MLSWSSCLGQLIQSLGVPFRVVVLEELLCSVGALVGFLILWKPYGSVGTGATTGAKEEVEEKPGVSGTRH